MSAPTVSLCDPVELRLGRKNRSGDQIDAMEASKDRYCDDQRARCPIERVGASG